MTISEYVAWLVILVLVAAVLILNSKKHALHNLRFKQQGNEILKLYRYIEFTLQSHTELIEHLRREDDEAIRTLKDLETALKQRGR